MEPDIIMNKNKYLIVVEIMFILILEMNSKTMLVETSGKHEIGDFFYSHTFTMNSLER